MTVAVMTAFAYSEARSAARFEHKFQLPYRPRTVPQHQVATVINLAEQRERRGLPRWGLNSPIRHEEPAPGTHAAAGAAWLSREHYLQVIVERVVVDFRDVLKEHKAGVDTFRRWVATESLYAQDMASGRDVIVRPKTVAELMSTCKRTVNRCRAAARAIGMLVDIVAGRMLTVEESTAARKQGSPQRGLSNVSCFVVPQRYHHTPTAAVRPAGSNCGTKSAGREPFVGCVTPTRGTRSKTFTSSPNNSRTFNAHSATGTTDAAPPRHRKGKADSAGRKLALDLCRRVVWLQTCPPGRIAAQLAPYAKQAAAWTVEDLIAAFSAIDAQHGYWSPQESRTRPWGLLRWYLAQISPAHDQYRRRARRLQQVAWCGDCESASYRWITHPSGWAEPCPTCSPQAVATRLSAVR